AAGSGSGFGMTAAAGTGSAAGETAASGSVSISGLTAAAGGGPAAGETAAAGSLPDAGMTAAGEQPELQEISVHREKNNPKTGPVGRTAHSGRGSTYTAPPFDLLEKGSRDADEETDRELKETAYLLQETLRTFGVQVTITDISRGPSVTRYELMPDQGVKVSRIVNLSDDIKLRLAATDIRIEAPIPGKSAIGIEVPNKHNSTVQLRDILESREFRRYDGKLPFSVGKDIAGKIIIADIARMPHLLIAGATGSGKSVCINTVILSILYKTSPDQVRLLMIDPKVVELSVYKKIPHLIIPVVTDPRKASAALNWAVAEMENRYKLFAAAGVRDLNGYNALAEEWRQKIEAESGVSVSIKQGAGSGPLPRLVIIVDELADLMMVSKSEVESSICRLAQLARAAGIHLIIATQRPSVDVITGLIKANMPSRIAFAVSSQVDSRTILDMAGAEKLIGKGDMLFYPQNYQKPARIQGAFVSDEEVIRVVKYISTNNASQTRAQEDESGEIARQIENIEENGMPVSGAEEVKSVPGRDEYFADAGRFIIEKNKASIGLLQRVFKIGFNRAARIMDQLAEAGVVSEESSTRARQVLMTIPEFENYLENET
ncbi:MAG: DNA translocase FtsK, partial [Eubacteriales bacterium]|nr:DNA translocase FtsK [Eubacteriales bacterium]